ncbi:HDOD domain-containing protein [Caldichromatium japonicum]|uniref:HDOD domain-containing protein n=1 Tax=Caldichromatium japonicum TaxID=2699430 RepID=A0A6G7VCH9_9GAMM|nr:HDOD domain-containing protein [Caldichromatium japonicum]QIK37783.1 HDOD domain-containing protein [Caldichromatium japonicum]
MPDSLLGIQPIFNRQRAIVAYELLFRSPAGGFDDDPVDAESATVQVILNAFIELGVERLGRDKRLFLNMNETLLNSELIQTLPPKRVVLEILETVRVTPELVATAQRLVEQGFVLALDDFVYTPEWDPLLALARIIKFDVLGVDRAAIAAKIAALPAGHRLHLLAEKVETAEQFRDCLELGFDLFQGYYLARPQIISGHRPPANRLQALHLLARLQDDEIGLMEVEQLISRDVTLSYRLLRFIGNAAISQGRPLHTLRQAITLVGLHTIRQWAALLILGSMEGVNPYSFTRALTYALFCQIVGERHFPEERDRLFTAGLFANLDEILLIPLREALEPLPLGQMIKGAILRYEGLLGCVLLQAKQIEDGEQIPNATLPGVGGEQLAVYFLEAFARARALQHEIECSASR